ncbi:LysR family transcriptional regulator [Acinetobacter venetianus]|jgi:LysR family malonate utilization transcriptional regulator|uniref:LysR family transcriptional regulator n=1 Tax=Acinetobacter TaxID=469 RepID=UPI0007756697|nr:MULTISPECIES: LysR substrate-binding domain-containing protein [Acinetobacter]KXO85417.1 LysR family transcriptional regulator [Acinetobacter venetianus]KXZ66238.1 HTH-type transcriptional regulator CynR [Acinetobacter venetianus]MBC68166.1 LysR family transcriptional regulator [Acinetobacter sp.]MBT51398.1 LysR family transcriptional regulator [Acinetobacter sp.]HIQ36141.1 LysR family transcriptional regulator [Acinetobacter venetianus]
MEIDEDLTLRKIQIFLAFMRYGNLSKTAAEMQISNVSVHKALHSLENSLRCPLFKNEGRNLIPLKSAYVLQENSQKIVQDIVTAVNKTREAAGFAAKVLHLGSLYSLTVNTIPNVISGLKLRRGELDIQLLLSSNLDLVKKLKTTELDAIIVALNETTSDADFESLAMFQDDIYLAVNKNSPLASLEEIDLSTLKDETFLTLSKGFATRHDSDVVFEKAGIDPKVFLQVSDIFTLISMVSTGVGLALLPGRISTIYESSVKLIPLQSPYQIKQEIGLVFLKSKERDPNLLALIAECRMFARQYL